MFLSKDVHTNRLKFRLEPSLRCHIETPNTSVSRNVEMVRNEQHEKKTKQQKKKPKLEIPT